MIKMKKLLAIALLVLTVASLSSCKNKKKSAEAEDPNVIVLFDGSSTDGWRGYDKTTLPSAWTIEDGCLKINGSGNGEAGAMSLHIPSLYSGNRS